MSKKIYIIPAIHSEHLILGGALAQIPSYGDSGSQVNGSQGLTKERDTYEYEERDWGEVEKTIW